MMLTTLIVLSRLAISAPCSDSNTCPSGYVCNGGCCSPSSQKINCTSNTECATYNGETCANKNTSGSGYCTCTGSPTVHDGRDYCDCKHILQSIVPCACKGDAQPVCSTSTGCSCGSAGLKPTLRLGGRWEQINNLTYHPAGDADLMLTRTNGATFSMGGNITQAAARWSNVTCCPGKTLGLALVSTAGAGDVYAGETNDNLVGAGGKMQPDVIKRIWATHSGTQTSPSASALTAGVLATTPVIVDGGQLRRSRMVVDGYNFKWRDGGSGDGVAYDINTVLTHEFGHFIGFQHSSCSRSIMYPKYSPNVTAFELDEADITSLCSNDGSFSNTGYGPVGCSGYIPPLNDMGMPVGPTNPDPSKQQRGETCAMDSECQAPYKCASGGSCQLQCTSEANCPRGEVCDWQLGGSTYCRIRDPQADGGQGGGSGAVTSDFCAPCERHDDCLKGVCIQMSSGAKICSGYCTTNDACGSAASCLATSGGDSVCVPNNPSCVQGAADARAHLNEACGEDNQCGPNLQCIQLVNAAVCLEKCNTAPEGRRCGTAGYECYEFDAATHDGVCFKAVMREGESCLLPDQSLCGFGGRLACFFTDNSKNQAACHKLCNGPFGNSCAEGQNCTQDPGAAFGVCLPLSPGCNNPLGTKCASDDDCSSGACASIRSEQICTRACDADLQSGCPEGFRCEPTPGAAGGFCFPSNGVVQAATCSNTKKKGCGCHGATDPGDALVVVMALAFVLRRRLRAGAIALSTLALLVAGSAQATTMVDMSDVRLAAKSDVIVHARVLNAVGRATPQARVYTDVTLEVIEAIKGAEPGMRLRVSYPGGRTPALGMHVAGQVAMSEGDEVVVYLRKADDGVLVPAAMRLGFYEVTRRAYDGVRVATRNTDGLQLVSQQSQDSEQSQLLQRLQAQPARVDTKPLGELIARIRADVVKQ